MNLRDQTERPADVFRAMPDHAAARAAASAERLADRAAVEAATSVIRPGSPDAHVLQPAGVLRLQRTAGNREVVALLERARGNERRASGRRVVGPSGMLRTRRPVQRDFLDDVGDAVSDTVGAVADTASEAAGTVAEGAGQAWDTATETAGAVADTVTETAGDAWDAASTGARAVGSAAGEVANGVAAVASDVAGTVADTAGEAWDTVTDTVSDVGNTIAGGASAAWDEVTDLASTAVDGVTDVAGRAWDGLADTARDVASGASEVVANAWNAVADGADHVWNGIAGAARGAWDAVSGAAGGAWDALKTTASNIAEGARDLAVDAWEGIKSAAGAAWDAVSGALGSLWSSIMSGVDSALEAVAQHVPLPGDDVRSRGLTDPERALAHRVFGDAIDYDAIVVTRGSLLSGGADRTTGNTVNLGDSDFDGGTMNLTQEGTETLIHEMTHVLQFQRGGLGYIPESLWEQVKAWRETGSRNAAYDWRPLDTAGVPWDQWNVEQQAEAVEDYNKELMKMDRGERYDAALIARLQKYVDEMRAGPRH